MCNDEHVDLILNGSPKWDGEICLLRYVCWDILPSTVSVVGMFPKNRDVARFLCGTLY